MTEKIAYHEIETFDFWVVPDAGSFMLTVVTASGKETKVLITQAEDLEDATEDMIPGRIYINDHLIDLKSEEEANILTILKLMVQNDQLGHKQGLAVWRAKEIIQFFSTGEAEKIQALLNNRRQG